MFACVPIRAHINVEMSQNIACVGRAVLAKHAQVTERPFGEIGEIERKTLCGRGAARVLHVVVLPDLHPS